MLHQYAYDQRILTPPKELEPLLKGLFPAFIDLLGHIRFFYMADEIWDGKSSLIFNTDGEQLASIILDDSIFHVRIANKYFQIVDEVLLDNVFKVLMKTVPISWHRPIGQLSVNPDPNVFPCGYLCDLCLGYKCHNGIDISGSDNFV